MNTIYADNLETLKEVRPSLYEGIIAIEEKENAVLIGDALDGEKFLAVLDGENVIPLTSTYHPAHAAEQYMQQFSKEMDDITLLLFGFGDGQVVGQALSEEYHIEKCIVYEPSPYIFMKVLEEYDIRSLLTDTRLLILLEDVNGNELEKVLYEYMNYKNWKKYRFCSLPKYDFLFKEDFKSIRDLYQRMRGDKIGEMNTLINFAQAGIENEVKALKWMIDSRALSDMAGKFPKELPCIMVAAGPSLEKNVEVLKQAKGKSFIICVDSAINFLLEREIMPDMICTIDPKKGPSYFTRPEIRNLPFAISSDSDYRAMEQVGEVNPIYFSTTNDYFRALYERQGSEVDYFDGGGSVGTVCFQIGVELGFQTIIIIGQDLAFTDRKAHAGKGKATEADLFYNVLMVDAYDGGKVMTRGDFKHYIDWYNMRISELDDRTIINATEGGAKLQGAIQMPLQEAVNRYCKDECDVSEIIKGIPQVWSTRQDKEAFYQEIKKKYSYFSGFRRRVKDGINDAQRAIMLLKRGNYQQKELINIDKKLDHITTEVSEGEGIVILVKRMINTDLTLTDDIHDAEEDLELESIRLYGKMEQYLRELLDALEELLPLWDDVMKEINSKYQFE